MMVDALKKDIVRLQLEKDAVENELAHRSCYFAAINFPVIFLDLDLMVVDLNGAGEEAFGEPGRVIGLPCWELLQWPTDYCIGCPLEPDYCGESEKGFEDIDYSSNSKIYRITCSPVMEQGELTGYVMSALDITQQKQLEQQLVQARRTEAIATRIGGVAHDFNNILGVILGNADFVLYRMGIDVNFQGDIGGPGLHFSEVREHFLAIKEAAIKAKDLVGQIVAISRQGKGVMQQQDIKPIIKEAVKLLRSSLPSTISIIFNEAPGVGQIYSDSNQIYQVMMSLGANAAQAMEEEGGKLVISLREENVRIETVKNGRSIVPGRYVLISIADTGHGMSKTMMKRKFDTFYTTSDVGRGKNMDLSVVDGIVAAHGGVVEVTSELEKGSTFNVYFPRCNIESDLAENLFSPTRGSETILFVDDEEDLVMARKRMLESLGYKVYLAHSGKGALALFEKYNKEIDIIITDYTIPDMTGLQLAARMQKICNNIQIILYSGCSNIITLENAHRAGIKRLLKKPLNINMLSLAVRDVLGGAE
ncbi:MAG: response regulator [Desulfobulbaceae bacterium]|nr:response regulator [Desulfobulbaceae bacterium]